MSWKILLLAIAGLILLLGVTKAWRDVRQKKPGRNPTRDLIITVMLAFLAGIYPIVQLLQPNKIEERLKPIPEIAKSQERIEQKFDQLRQEMREMGKPIRYEDGIPQSPNLNLRVLFDEGQKHLDNHEYEKAIKAFRTALGLQDLKPSESAALLISIGHAQFDQSKWDEAEGNYKEALDWAEKGEDDQGQATAFGNLGLVCQNKGEWDKAIEFFEKSLEIMVKTGDERGMATTFYGLGVVYHGKGERDKAIEFFQKALKVSEKIGDEPVMAVTKVIIGLLHIRQGKKEEGKRLLEEGLRMFERLGIIQNADSEMKELEDLLVF